jgi:hypothetical protein
MYMFPSPATYLDGHAKVVAVFNAGNVQLDPNLDRVAILDQLENLHLQYAQQSDDRLRRDTHEIIGSKGKVKSGN